MTPIFLVLLITWFLRKWLSISGLMTNQEEYCILSFLKLMSNSNMNMLKILKYVLQSSSTKRKIHGILNL